MRSAFGTRSAVIVATALALVGLAVPVLLAPASGAGQSPKVGSTAIVASARGAVLMATVTGTASAVKVTFTCRGGRSASTRTLGGVSTDTAVVRLLGADAHGLTGCSARAGASRRSLPLLRARARAAGARLVALLGVVRSLPGSIARLDVVLSGRGTITVATAGGRTLLKTGRRGPGVQRLRVKNAPRGTILVVRALGRSDSSIVGGLSAAPKPTPTPGATPTPTPVPSATPTPAPTQQVASILTISCPANVAIGAPINVTGRLSPNGAGAPIVVTFAMPGRPTVTTTATTDAAGSYSAQHTDPNGAGTFSITAAFAGNAGLAPSQAGPCTTTSP
jgi:hypothetical protein